jgi:hypothetical protein
MAIEESACHHCQNRCVGCHSSCEEYLAWAKKTREDAAGNKAYNDSHVRARAKTTGFNRVQKRQEKAVMRRRYHDR